MSGACEQLVAGLAYFPQATAEAREAVAGSALIIDLSTEPLEDPFVLLAKSARGEIAAQRTLADIAIMAVMEGRAPDPLSMLLEGLVFARMAASRGEDVDLIRLAHMLGLAGYIAPDPDTTSDLAGEMLALVEILADRGHDNAATLLASMAAGETAVTMETAVELKARISAAWGF